MSNNSASKDRLLASLGHENVLAFVGLCASLWIFLPGWLSADSVAQLTQAYSWSFNDWHPVMMAMWWGLTSSVFGPSFLLLQQLVFYWAGWAVVSKTLSSEVNSRFRYLVLLGFLPTFLLPFGHIWKDNQFASIMFFTTAWLLQKHFKKTKFTNTQIIFICALMIYAVGVKPNGAIAIFLLLIWASKYFLKKTYKWQNVMVILGGTMAFASVLIISLALSNAVAPQKVFSAQSSMIHDIQGIANISGEDLRPEFAKELIDFERFSTSYQPDNANYLLFLHSPETLRTEDPLELRQIQDTWVKSISTHPLEYLKHRTDIFLASLRVARVDAGFVANGFSDPNDFGFSGPSSPAAQVLIKSITSLPWLYFPWVGILGVLGSIIVSLARNRTTLGITLYVSLIYFSFLAPHFFVVPGTDYRYYLFSTLLTPILIALTWTGVYRTQWNRVQVGRLKT